MVYLLDTNAAIALMKGHPLVLNHVRRAGRGKLYLYAPVEAELWPGVCKSGKPEENRERLLTLLSWLPSLPFAGKATRHFGKIRAFLASQRTFIGPYDLQIGAIARAHGMTLLIHNTCGFSCIPGLVLEDWQG
jgi:tRNA(fMet)-specific endonuclease VapC